MRIASLIFSVLAVVGFAAAQAGVSPVLLQSFLDALRAAGQPAVAEVISTLNTTVAGAQLVASLLSAPNTLVFPLDPSALLAIITNVDSLLPMIQYHTFLGTFNQSTVANSPNHTIARSHLVDSSLVHLEAGQAQVAVFTIANGNLSILNQPAPTTLTQAFTFQDFLLLIANNALQYPGSLQSAISQYNLTSFGNALNTAGSTTPLTRANGVTIFAPINTAIPDNNPLKNPNASAIAQAIGNYVIENNSVYMSSFSSGARTSVSGSQLQFSNDGSGWTIKSGKTSAKIIQTDVLLNNGVLHVIDNVLAKDSATASGSTSGEPLRLDRRGVLCIMVGACIVASLL